MSRREGLVEALLGRLVCSSLTPIAPAALVRLAESTLDEALAEYATGELRSAIRGLDAHPDLRLDRAGRWYARQMARHSIETVEHREAAAEIAGLIADIEAPAQTTSFSLVPGLFSAPLLSPTEERFLARRVSHGDRAALRRLVEANTRLTWTLAKQWAWRETPGLAVEDYFQQGCLGLIRAAEKFDPQRGFRFSTYATWWIRQAMQRGMQNHARTIRLPVHVVQEVANLSAIERDLASRLGREPSLREVASRSGLDFDQIEESRAAGHLPISLETLIGPEDDPETIPLDGPGPDEEVEAELEEQAVRRALGRLDPRARLVIELRYGFAYAKPVPLREAAKHTGLSAEGVRNVERRALRMLAEDGDLGPPSA